MDDELERLLRATLADRAEQAPTPQPLADEVLTRLGIGDGPPVDAVFEPTVTPAGDGGDPTRAPTRLGSSRARRRRLTRVLVPLAAAASVAAVVAIGLSVPDHQRDSGASAGAGMAETATGADRVGPTAALGQPSGGTQTPKPTSTDRPDNETASGASYAALPVGFQVTDLSFDTPTTGFALGTLPCGKGRCPALATLGGAGTWSLVSKDLPFIVVANPKSASPAVTDASITHIRFADADTGYAYGTHSLYVTTNGGTSWTSAPRSLLAVEVADETAAAVQTKSCGSTCNAYTWVWASAGSTDFKSVTPAGASVQGSSAYLARAGANVYVVVNDDNGGRVHVSADGGRTYGGGSTTVCAAPGVPDADVTSLAAASDGSVTALCTAGQRQYTAVSTDGGTTFADGQVLTGSPATAVAAASASVLLLGGADLARSIDGGKTWQKVPVGAATATNDTATTFLGFESATNGRWVSDRTGVVWTTTDGGATFSPYAFS
jgi:hypothetical protein